MLKKIVLLIIVLGLLGGAYGYFFMYNKSHPDYENLDAEFSLSAKELFSDCKEKGLSANYTGKLLEISGTPSDIEIQDSLVIMVFAFEEGMFGSEGLRVSFLPSYTEEVKNIQKNKKLRIKAYCTGYNDTDVILEKASLIK